MQICRHPQSQRQIVTKPVRTPAQAWVRYSRNRDYYELWPVEFLISPRKYAMNHLVRDAETGNTLLMGHVTTLRRVGKARVRIG